MKKVLLICGLLAITNTLIYGQAAQVSKSGFTEKTKQLQAKLEHSNASDANADWDNVHKMMMEEMAAVTSRVKAAYDAGDNATTKRLTELYQNQYSIYYSILEMKSDMVKNRAALTTKLGAFAATMQ